MNPLSENPFAVLTLIVAPAVMTNCTSVLILSTSNRFARTIDRARTLTNLLESGKLPNDDPVSQLRVVLLGRQEARAKMLLQAMQLFYVALGSFASASLITVIGAGLATMIGRGLLLAVLGIAGFAGIMGVGGIVAGCLLLVRETRIALNALNEESEAVRKKYQLGGSPA
jgi:hypothetical protein